MLLCESLSDLKFHVPAYLSLYSCIDFWQYKVKVVFVRNAEVCYTKNLASFLISFLPFRECPTDVMCNRFSDDGTLLAVGLINGTIKVSFMYILIRSSITLNYRLGLMLL